MLPGSAFHKSWHDVVQLRCDLDKLLAKIVNGLIPADVATTMPSSELGNIHYATLPNIISSTG